MQIEKIETIKRIVVIDSHPISREGIKHIANRTRNLSVVGEAGTGREGLKVIKQLDPDLVIMEIWLQDQNTIQLIRDIKQYFPRIFVAILTLYHEAKYIVQAFRAGATGYFLKETDISSFLRGCETVVRGDHYLDTSVSPELLMSIKGIVKSTGKKVDLAHGQLTLREQEITRLLAMGVTRKEIAASLCISPKTVENHISNILKKLRLRNIIDLVRWAAGLGLINMDEWIGKTNSYAYPHAVAYNQ